MIPTSINWLEDIPLTSPYYDYRKANEFSPSVHVLMGGRSLGKTNFKKRMGIYETLTDGSQTIYMRRFKDEIKKAKSEYIKDLIEADERLKDVEMKIIGDTLFVNKVASTIFIALSQTTTYKSVVYNKVNRLIFDEFLTIGYTVKGANEITLFSEYLDTVFRLRSGWHLDLISNAISSTSEYFKLFGFSKPINPNRRFQQPKHNDKILVEIYKDSEFRKAKENSQLYTLMKSDHYVKYAIESQMLDDNFKNVIQKREIRGHTDVLFNIRYEDKVLTIHQYDKVKLHVTDFYKNTLRTITFNKEDVILGGEFVTASSPFALKMTLALNHDLITFDDIEIKKTFTLFIKQIISTFY